MNRRDFITKLPALAALVALPEISFARTSQSRKGVVTAAALNVRIGPGIHNPPVGVLHSGAHVTIHDYAHGWYEISSHRISGWASGSYINPVGSNSSPHHNDNHEYDGHEYSDRDYVKPPRRRRAVIGYSRWGYANMFDGPGRRYQIIARLDEGERVKVIEQGGRWALIRKRGVGRGYIRSKFLEYDY